MKSFFEQVYDIVEKIPAGYVLTYGDIAKMLEKPRMARFVGFAMSAVCETDNRPWHRVTFSDGRLWDGEWEKVQRKLLKNEGVTFTKDGKINLKKHRWHADNMMAPTDLRDLPLKF